MRDLIQYPLNVLDTRSAYLDTNGKLLANGRLVIYKDNTSTELAEVYSDINLEHPVENPVYLDQNGRTNTGLYTGKPVFVSVERPFGKNNDGSEIYVQIYSFETHSGLEIDALFNSNYVKDRMELKAVKNRNPTWVIEEGDTHLYVLKEGVPPSNDGIIHVDSLVFPGYYWYWETKEIYADQAGINNKGYAFNIEIWSTLSSLSMNKKYKIIIPKGTYYFGNQAMPNLTFSDFEIQSGVSFTGFKSWNISIEDRVECLSRLEITWAKLPLGKFYDRNIFYKINAATLTKLNIFTSEGDIHLSSGNTFTKNLTAIKIEGTEIKSSGPVIFNGDLKVEGTITAKEMEISKDTEINGDITVRSIEITRELNVKGNHIKVREQDIDILDGYRLSSFFAKDEVDELKRRQNLRNFLDRFMPIGSYTTTYRSDPEEPINRLYWLYALYQGDEDAGNENWWLDVTMHKDRSQANDIVFRGCGMTGWKVLPGNNIRNGGYILIRRIA